MNSGRAYDENQSHNLPKKNTVSVPTALEKRREDIRGVSGLTAENRNVKNEV